MTATIAKRIIWLPTKIHPIAMDLANNLFDVITPSDSRAKNWTEYAEGSVVRTGGISETELLACKKLKIIARNGAGYDTIPVELCRKLDVRLTNLPGQNAIAVAEIALGLAISVSRRITEFDRRLRRGEILPSIDWMAQGLQGKIIGVVGMGHTSRETCRKFYGAFDAKIIVYSPTSSLLNWTDKDPSGSRPIPHTRVNSLEEMLAIADVVSLHCPLLPETHNMMSTEQFKSMKKDAILINTSRGGMVDEEALLYALKTGEIAGAGLDALVNEPASLKNYPELFSLENVVVLPHAGAGTTEVQIDGCVRAVRTVEAYLNGEGVFGSNIVV